MRDVAVNGEKPGLNMLNRSPGLFDADKQLGGETGYKELLDTSLGNFQVSAHESQQDVCGRTWAFIFHPSAWLRPPNRWFAVNRALPYQVDRAFPQ